MIHDLCRKLDCIKFSLHDFQMLRGFLRRLTIGDTLFEEVTEAIGDTGKVLVQFGLRSPHLAHFLLQLPELLYVHILRAALINILVKPLALDGCICNSLAAFFRAGPAFLFIISLKVLTVSCLPG